MAGLSLDTVEHRWNNVENVEFKDLIEVAQLSQRQAAIAIARVDRFHNLFLEASKRVEELEAENARLRSIISQSELDSRLMDNESIRKTNLRNLSTNIDSVNDDVLDISEEEIQGADISRTSQQLDLTLNEVVSSKIQPLDDRRERPDVEPSDFLEITPEPEESATSHENGSRFDNSMISETTELLTTGSHREQIAAGIAKAFNKLNFEIHSDNFDEFSVHSSGSVIRSQESKDLVPHVLAFLQPIAVTATLGLSSIQRDTAVVVPLASLRANIRRAGLVDNVHVRMCDVDIILSRVQKGQKQLTFENATVGLVVVAGKRFRRLGPKELSIRLTAILKAWHDKECSSSTKQMKISAEFAPPLAPPAEISKAENQGIQFVFEKEFPALKAIYDMYMSKFNITPLAHGGLAPKGLSFEAVLGFAKDYDLYPQFVSRVQVQELFQSVVEMFIEHDPAAQGFEPTLEYFQFEIWLLQLALRCPQFYDLGVSALNGTNGLRTAPPLSPSAKRKKPPSTPRSSSPHKISIPPSIRLFHLLKCLEHSRGGKLRQTTLRSRTSRIINFRLNYKDKLLPRSLSPRK